MEFSYSREQQMVKQMLKDFAENEIAPISAEIDEKAIYPYETVAKLAKLGLMGMPFPPEYGGAGTDYLTYIMAIEEISKVDASHGVIIQTHNALCCWPIYTYGTEEQKRKYLPDLLSGKHLGAFGLTEPNAGTDAAGTQTKAVLDGDEWVLNGSKIFISGGGIADVYVIMAMTDKSKGTKGISSFIVEKGDPGFTVPKHENKMGIRGSIAAELVFEDCRIPKDRLLGQEGKGFKVAMSSLDVGRLGIAAQALGIAQGAQDELVAYVQQRVQFGRPIAKFQNTQFQIADMEARICASRWLVYDAAYRKYLSSQGQKISYGKEAAMAKLFAAETAMAVTTKVVQLHGGYGYIKEYPVERMMRDAKITEIYEGTSEVQRMVIARSVIK